MRKEINFQSLGISKNQEMMIKNHLRKAESFVVPKDPGIDGAMVWINDSLNAHLPGETASALYKIASENKPVDDAEYLECGYDSCQSRRKVAKVVGEAIFLGGLAYEFGLLGIEASVGDISEHTGSELSISKKAKKMLPDIAKEFGAKQDFLFPGVTPTDETTLGMEDFAYHALHGTPKTSVRNLTGVGGVRFDKDWNFVFDFASFIKLKISEDKRYYPGIGIYWALLTLPIDEIPLIKKIKLTSPATYGAFYSFSEKLKAIPEKKYEGVSVLCSAYMPNWNEMKAYRGFGDSKSLEISESFHSPAYDFAQLKMILNKTGGLSLRDDEIVLLRSLTDKFSNLWTFNSTIHLSWTSALAGLSNDLIGTVTNHNGDWAVRYGLGYKGKSIEVREYNFGVERKFPQGLSGKKAYALIGYPASDSFEGDKVWDVLVARSDLWIGIEKNGFIGPMLEYLEIKP